MLTSEDFIAGLGDQLATLIVQTPAGMVRDGSGFLQGSVSRDDFTGDQILADAKMLERALRLSTPQFVRRHLNHTKAVALCSHVRHVRPPGQVN
jgi:hypothetical protein